MIRKRPNERETALHTYMYGHGNEFQHTYQKYLFLYFYDKLVHVHPNMIIRDSLGSVVRCRIISANVLGLTPIQVDVEDGFHQIHDITKARQKTFTSEGPPSTLIHRHIGLRQDHTVWCKKSYRGWPILSWSLADLVTFLCGDKAYICKNNSSNIVQV